MRLVLRLMAMAVIFVVVSLGWMVLGATTQGRSSTSSWDLRSKVGSLWGESLVIAAPSVHSAWEVTERREESWRDEDGRSHTREVDVLVTQRKLVVAESTSVTLDVGEDVRRKGLVWFPLYDVDFDGAWTYTHDRAQAGRLEVSWPFPAQDGFYDDFEVLADGVQIDDATIEDGSIQFQLPVRPEQTVQLAVRFRSRGNEQLVYRPAEGVAQLSDFSVVMRTDFADVDFPEGTLSPSARTEEGAGWKIEWVFARMLAGKGVGVIVPCPVQPGELAASMAYSAPISLGLFMVWIFVLGLIRDVEVHPVNHAFLAGAFFAFHLLFAYSADHLPVEWAFALSAFVSMFLVLTYLVRVVSPRFAVVEAGLAQAIYLVGFALAHFWDGLTGLTLTVIGIGTLFALMQLTSHVNWSLVFSVGSIRGSSEGEPTSV